MADHDPFDDELVSSNTTQRNWRGILIALLVIVVVLALIVTSVVLLTPPDDGPRVKGARFSLHDVLGHDFQPLRFNGTWVSDNELILKDHWGGISILNAHNLSMRTLMSNHTYLRLNPSRYQLSPDQRYLLLAVNVQKLFRHSYLAQYVIYDIQTGNDFPLRPMPEEENHPFLLLAQWAPKGKGLIMVQDYNIYYRKSPNSHTGYMITNTAVPGVVSHGVPDWLYEEEILGTNTAIWMSMDGLMVVFATFDDSLVEEIRFPWYGADRLYPDVRSLRYPKPGTRNPIVTLTVADLADTSNVKKKRVLPPPVLARSDHYFTSVSWISSTEISVVWLNRPQNLSVITICSTPKWDCRETQRISGEGLGWVDPGDSPVFGPNGDTSNYVTVAPVRDGPAGSYRHAVAVNIPKRRAVPLTHGRYDVARILAWDHANDVIYFLGIPEGKPGQLHLFRVTSVPPRTGASLPPPVCLTCVEEPKPTADPFVTLDENVYRVKSTDWEDEDDEHVATTAAPRRNRRRKHPPVPKEPPCQYHNAHFSPTAAYYVLECLGPGVPTSALYRTAMPAPRRAMWLQNNTALRERVASMAVPQVRTFPVQISGGYNAQVRLHLPPGLREDEITRYPLVVQVYGGPGSQLVTDRWRVDWTTYLASHEDFVVAQIDGRGTGGQGHRVMHEVFRRLGKVEVADQLEVTEYLRDTQHFIDKRRVAVWGWSYGGFVATMALASPKKVFQCAIAVSPVTNWKLYDSAYTERFMGLPNVTDNYKGYEEADISRQAYQLKDKMFYLIHGTADDNVHLQQSMALVKALAEAGTLFRQQVYPDENHSLGGVKRHLYESMGHFLSDCYRKQIPPEFKAGLRDNTEDE
ncbi:unnamed protein product [Phaedon cochleariae]|uniref:Venom dipeptidyl peptidase 4 n=1 Tax=Phaedon cochleariae TaxID=80249 RepID=A0A9P0GNU0_PHACE|nr:unnamed protein product [Phaedon cochleariae]